MSGEDAECKYVCIRGEGFRKMRSLTIGAHTHLFINRFGGRMWCFRPTHDLKATKEASKCRLYFSKCLKQHKNHCMVVVTVQTRKQNLIIPEGPEKDAPSRKTATRRLWRERGGCA